MDTAEIRRLAVIVGGLAFMSAARAAPASGQEGPQLLVDADACPRPPFGLYDPQRLAPYENAIRDMLIPDYAPGVFLQVVIAESFAPPMLIAIDVETDQTRGYSAKVRVVRAKKDLWSAMLRAAQRGTTTSLDDNSQRRALTRVPRAASVKVAKLQKETVGLVSRVFNGIMNRTQHVSDASGAPVVAYKTDGTAYDVWANGRSARIDSPEDGTLLKDFTDFADAIGTFVDVADDRRAAAETALRNRATLVLKRIARQEPCLKARQRDGAAQPGVAPDGASPRR